MVTGRQISQIADEKFCCNVISRSKNKVIFKLLSLVFDKGSFPNGDAFETQLVRQIIV